MMSCFSEGLHRTTSIGRRRRLPLLTRVILMAALATTASAYADNEKRDYFGDYRVPAGFTGARHRRADR